ncbi:MAG: CdiA family toxin C-terminal domain-containing protein, partial [Candidatus Xenobia bacterium]
YQSGLGDKANPQLAQAAHEEAIFHTGMAVLGMIPPIGAAAATNAVRTVEAVDAVTHGAEAANVVSHAAETLDATKAVKSATEAMPERLADTVHPAAPPVHASATVAENPDVASVAADHMWSQAPSIAKRTKGIVGGHNAETFERALQDQGEVVSSRAVPGLDGVSQVKYRMFKMERGQITKELQAGDPMEKTLFDPKKWNQEKIAKLGNEVFKGITTDGTQHVTHNGTKFVGWIRGGVLQSFGVEF